MGLKLAADFDLELFFSELDKRQAKRDEDLRRYLEKPHADIRQLFGSIETPAAATPPVFIDLGAPGGGLLWSVQQVCLQPGFTLVSSAVSNVAAGIFVGAIPPLNFALDWSALSAGGLAVPSNYQAGGKSIICRHQQHLYVVFQGTGIASQGYRASATVLQVPDTPEALLWL